MAKRNKKCGWIPDLPDHRDIMFCAALHAPQPPVNLPPSIDLRPLCPPVYTQGELGSCTANAIGAAHEFMQQQQKKTELFIPSRLFIYYNERVMGGTTRSDSGAQIRDGIKSVANLGVCPETEWPYDISVFRNKPPLQCFKHALLHQALNYYSVPQTLIDMKTCLASNFPIILGLSVYSSFESSEIAKTGIVQMPQPNESQIGGHAVLAVGYDDASSKFIIRNSWGDSWGQNGYFTIPYDYLTNSNLTADLWAIKLVE